jgi:hypothetical protein
MDVYVCGVCGTQRRKNTGRRPPPVPAVLTRADPEVQRVLDRFPVTVTRQRTSRRGEAPAAPAPAPPLPIPRPPRPEPSKPKPKPRPAMKTPTALVGERPVELPDG